MSFNTTCHLSGLTIKEGEEVIYLPIQYGQTETSPLCYVTSDNVSPFFIPVVGTYNGYGAIDIEETHLIQIKNFIEDKLKKKEICFLKTEYNTIKESEFIQDKQIINIFSNKKEMDDLSLSDLSSSEFLDAIQHIFGFSQGKIIRYGFILIKKSFLDNYIQKEFKKEFSLIKNNINDCIYKDYERNENETDEQFKERNAQINIFQISKALLFFNDSYLPIENSICKVLTTLRAMNTTIKKNEVFSEFTLFMAYLGMIQYIYRRLGKSFYPKVNTPNSDKFIIKFGMFISTYKKD